MTASAHRHKLVLVSSTGAGFLAVNIAASLFAAINGPQGRLRLLEKNAEFYRQIIPRIVNAEPKAVLVVATDPPELADVAREIAGQSAVLSAGTYLDSQRFRVHMGQIFGVDPAHVEAQVIDEHGTSQVFLWSSVRVGGVAVSALLRARGEQLPEVREKLREREVRYANITIIEGHEASQFGIGIDSARVAEMVLTDERAVQPLPNHADGSDLR